MNKVYRVMFSLKNKKLFILFFIIFLVSNSFIGMIKYFVFIDDNPNKNLDLIDISFFRILLSIVISPFLETIIFQKYIIGFSRIFIRNNLICITISAILFGLLHYDSTLKILQTMFMGLWFGLFYTVLEKKGANSFLQTASLHSFWNLFVIIITNIANFFS